jgi:hypothetical protein
MCRTLRSCAALAALAVVTFSGCGVKLAEVTGTVTVNGKPAAGLDVVFEPQSPKGPPSFGVTKADGTYELKSRGRKKGAIIGTHRVSVNQGDVAEGVIPLTIPPKYNLKSELTTEVKSGANTYNIDIVGATAGNPGAGFSR